MDWSKVIFLAHASEDKPLIRKIYNKFRENGLEPWLDDEDLEPGTRWDDSIKIAIKKSRFFLACISRNSITKTGYIQKELKLALSELEQKPADVIYFIPVLIEDVDLPNINIGTINLRDYHATKVFTEGGLIKLIKYLKKQINVIEDINSIESDNYEKMREFITKGDTELVLSQLTSSLLNSDNNLRNNLILLQSRFHNLRQRETLGVLSPQEYALEFNRINLSILETIRIIESQKN